MCQDLSKHLVHNHSDIEEMIILGNANRTIASTDMNYVSSRSHAIFTISFTQVNTFPPCWNVTCCSLS